MKILVTGGAGYIGSVVVERLVADGEAVVVFDNLSQGHRAAVHPEAAFIEGDLLSRPAIDAALAEHRPDAVMHFASHTLVGESMQRPFLYLGENVVGGLNLLESMIDHGAKRFILSSTANLFDAPERMPIDEDERIEPGSPYGESKHILERMLYWLDRVHGLRYAALRYFNAAGASDERGEDHDPELHLIPIVLQVALGQRSDVTIFGDRFTKVDVSTVAGRNLRARLHPRRRSGSGACAGPAGARRRQPRLQSRQRPGVQRSRGNRDGPADHRPSDPGEGRPAATGRSGHTCGQQREDSPRTRLGAAISHARRDHRDGLAVASAASAGV